MEPAPRLVALVGGPEPSFKRSPALYGGVKRTIHTDDAPEAVGAYSQATTDGDVLFTAGQLPMTADGELLDDASVADQTRRCLENVEAILEAEDASMADVLKMTIFLNDIDDFEEFNEAYGEFFDEEPPARSALEVGEVPKGAALEVEAIATLE